jgi:hypothetical protein
MHLTSLHERSSNYQLFSTTLNYISIDPIQPNRRVPVETMLVAMEMEQINDITKKST